MTATTAPYRSDLPVVRDSFAQLLWAEWTKFRTVRGWVITAIAAGLLIVLFAMTLSACAVVGGVFKAGMAVGIFAVVIVVVLLFFLFGRR